MIEMSCATTYPVTTSKIEELEIIDILWVDSSSFRFLWEAVQVSRKVRKASKHITDTLMFAETCKSPITRSKITK